MDEGSARELQAVPVSRSDRYSQYSSGSLPSMARMFAREHAEHRNSTPRRSTLIVQAAGMPPSGQEAMAPQREHVRLIVFVLLDGFAAWAAGLDAVVGGARWVRRGRLASPRFTGPHPVLGPPGAVP